jgi:hypothetical protein
MLRAAVVTVAVLGAVVVGATTAAVLWSIPPDVRYGPTAGDPAPSTLPTSAAASTHPTSEQPASSALNEAADRGTPRAGSVETLARVPLQRPDPQNIGCPSDGCEGGPPAATPGGAGSEPATPAPTMTRTTPPPPPVTEEPLPLVEPPPTSDSDESPQNSEATEE